MVDHPSVKTTPPYLLQCQGKSFFSPCFVKIIVVLFYIYLLSAIYLLAFIFSACVCVCGRYSYSFVHMFTFRKVFRNLGQNPGNPDMYLILQLPIWLFLFAKSSDSKKTDISKLCIWKLSKVGWRTRKNIASPIILRTVIISATLPRQSFSSMNKMGFKPLLSYSQNFQDGSLFPGSILRVQYWK